MALARNHADSSVYKYLARMYADSNDASIWLQLEFTLILPMYLYGLASVHFDSTYHDVR